MRIILSITMFFAVVLTSAADSKGDVYLVVTAEFRPSVDYSFRKKIFESHVICYPITYRKELFYEKAVKAAMENFLIDKDEDGKVGEVNVEVFEDRKEAVAKYLELTKTKDSKYRRETFTRSHIDRARKAFEEEIEAAKSKVVTEKVAIKRAIDDIYD